MVQDAQLWLVAAEGKGRLIFDFLLPFSFAFLYLYLYRSCCNTSLRPY